MLLKNKLVIVGLMFSVVLFFTACDKTWDDHYSKLDETTQKDKVISELEKIPEISDFTNAVKQIDTLVGLLGQNRLYTVLAPVNDAFNAISPEIRNNKTLFTRLVLYHFVDGKYKYKDLSYDDIKTFNNKFLNVSLDNNKVLFDGLSTIIQQDYLSQNGMIQVIDQPLMPKNNLFEFFEYNTFSDQFAKAIIKLTIKEFNRVASAPVGKNEQDEVIYDSVFIYSNPFFSADYVLKEPLAFYGSTVRSYIDITDETRSYTCVFPINYEAALANAKSSPFLNAAIDDHHYAGSMLSRLIFSRLNPYRYISLGLLTKEEYISAVNTYHAQKDADTIKVLQYMAGLLNSNYAGNVQLSNGIMHLVDGFEYDLGWLITDQAGIAKKEAEKDYLTKLRSNMSASDNVDTVYLETNNIKTVFYNDTVAKDYSSRYGESVSFDFDGSFYPVDYKIMVRGRTVASGTYKIEVDGIEVGQFDFSTAPGGDNDKVFNHIGTVSFTGIKSTTNLKLTFINTHPGANKGEQYLWIREVKFSPIIK